MSCCGQKRHALRTPTRTDGSWVAVEYRSRRDGAVEIEGVTGRSYTFSPETPVQTVHPRDARALLRSGAFRLV